MQAIAYDHHSSDIILYPNPLITALTFPLNNIIQNNSTHFQSSSLCCLCILSNGNITTCILHLHLIVSRRIMSDGRLGMHAQDML